MHNVSEFKYNSCKRLDNKSPIQTHLPKPCTLYKEAQGEERTTTTNRTTNQGPRTRERERSREKAQGAKKAKPERETERRRRSAEEERKAGDKRRARQKVEPHSNFLFFFTVAFIFLYHSAGSPKAMSSSLPCVTPRGSHKV